MDCATYLCEEIVIEILARLPAKSLVRFMAVCRLWKSIITSTQFRLVSKRPSKLLVHTNRECYSLVEDEEEKQNLVVMFETDFPLRHYLYESAVLMGSDNGLLCIGIGTPKSNGGGYSCLIIWNPCIRKHVVIPNNPIDDYITPIIEYVHGFGGTLSGRDYKYLRIVGFYGSDGLLEKAADIYSLKTGRWQRKYLDWDRDGIKHYSFTSALVRGRLHWIGGYRNQIFPFELEEEVFEDIITAPESIQPYYFLANVTVIRESLAVITNLTVGSQSTVWVMEEYGDVNSWIKLCNIDLTIEDFDGVKRNMVHLLKNGELLLGLSEYCKQHPKLVTYNPKTMKTSDFDGGAFSLSQVCGFTNYYKESLVLLGDHRAVEDQPLLDHQHGYYPVRTEGPGFHWYPLDHNIAPVLPMFFQPLQDQCGFYYVWTGFHWLQLINHNPFVVLP